MIQKAWAMHPNSGLISRLCVCRGVFLVAQLIKNPPAMQETPV